MEAAALSMFREEFANRAKWRPEDERRAFDQIKKEERDDKREREADEAMDYAVAVLATETEIADFNVKLDTYDAATVEALMDNEEALGAVRERIQIMLDNAYVLPDGRKVFKTEDGRRIFDERGQEVKDFDPNEIEESRPRWERFSEELEAADRLGQEREELVKYQNLLDKTREDANEDGLTKAELDDLEKRLQENVPDAVKRKLANEEPASVSKQEVAHDAAPFKPAGKLDMPSL